MSRVTGLAGYGTSTRLYWDLGYRTVLVLLAALASFSGSQMYRTSTVVSHLRQSSARSVFCAFALPYSTMSRIATVQ